MTNNEYIDQILDEGAIIVVYRTHGKVHIKIADHELLRILPTYTSEEQ